MKFLPRRAFENFLLHPAAIAAVIDSELRDGTVTESTVEAWLVAHGGEPQYQGTSGWTGDPTGIDWLTQVDAARVLNRMFSELSGTRLTFRKTVHSVALFDWLLENASEILDDLFEHLSTLVARNR